MKIVSGPNLSFYFWTALVGLLSFVEHSWKPILCWVGFLALVLAIALPLAKRDERQNRLNRGVK